MKNKLNGLAGVGILVVSLFLVITSSGTSNPTNRVHKYFVYPNGYSEPRLNTDSTATNYTVYPDGYFEPTSNTNVAATKYTIYPNSYSEPMLKY
jgi:hypothetical protein